MISYNPIVYNNERILMTVQIAESYGTSAIKIQQNFNNNKERYVEGKHYFLLKGQELRGFKEHFENFEVASKTSKLYLWTEKGAWLHAKSLGTDQAWEAYELLVDDYYRIKEHQGVAINNVVQIPTELNMLGQLSTAIHQSYKAMLQMQNQIVEADLKAEKAQKKAEAAEERAGAAEEKNNLLAEALNDVKNGLVDVNLPLRTQFNDAVKAYKGKCQLDWNIAYNNIYNILGKQHHVNIKLRAQNQGKKPIEVIEELNLLVPAIRLAKTMSGEAS